MKLTRRCPKCQGGRFFVTHLRVEVIVPIGPGTLGPVDRWYEEWVCGRCRFCERHALDAIPSPAVMNKLVEAPGGDTPYR